MTLRTSYQPGEPIWVDLATPDLDKTISWYGELFGWTCERGQAEFGGYSNFSKDGKLVAGVMPLMQEGMPAVWSCYVCSDDADKTAERVTEAGGTVVGPPMDVADLGRMAVFTAVDGAFFGVWQPRSHLGSERVGEEGCPSWIELATRDQQAALPFYEAVFGWQARQSPGYTELKLDGTSVAGCMDMPPAVPAEVPSYWMPYFGAQDPAAKAQQAVDLGATLLVPYTEMEDVAFSVVADLHGSAFGLLRMSA